jgi:hypothetical protein
MIVRAVVKEGRLMSSDKHASEIAVLQLMASRWLVPWSAGGGPDRPAGAEARSITHLATTNVTGNNARTSLSEARRAEEWVSRVSSGGDASPHR